MTEASLSHSVIVASSSLTGSAQTSDATLCRAREYPNGNSARPAPAASFVAILLEVAGCLPLAVPAEKSSSDMTNVKSAAIAVSPGTAKQRCRWNIKEVEFNNSQIWISSTSGIRLMAVEDT